MIKTYVVLHTEGKQGSVDFAKVVLFDNFEDANKYCSDHDTGYRKYWVKCEIVGVEELIELEPPEY